MGASECEGADSETGGLSVLVVGSGPLLAALEKELRGLGNGIEVKSVGIVSSPGDTYGAWGLLIEEADWVLFGSGEEHGSELRALEKACRQARKPLLPAVIARCKGVAGPLSGPDSERSWDSAWRRLRPSALGDGGLPRIDPASVAMLANLAITEWAKERSQPGSSLLGERIYLLDLRTVEGAFHSFLPHPLSPDRLPSPRRLEWEECPPGTAGPGESGKPGERDGLAVLSQLTSPVAGILHLWEEGDLKQLPLAQCRVQAADPRSTDGASLLPEAIGAGLTHREARLEAGLAGIEAYASRLAGTAHGLWVGAGFSMPEALNRALRHGLERYAGLAGIGTLAELRVRTIGTIEDVFCRYGLQALAIEEGASPLVAAGEECVGFPTMWVQAGGRWYGSAGPNRTLALRSAIRQALLREDMRRSGPAAASERGFRIVEALDGAPPLPIPPTEEMNSFRLWENSLNTLRGNGYRLSIYDLAAEPFLKERFAGVIGLLLEEVSE